MQEKRRLRKAEREIVESVAAKAVEELAPNFDEIERRVVEGYLGQVPASLRGEFIRA